jgi:hypothetical protein
MVDAALRAELLDERAVRDQMARNRLRRGHTLAEWEQTVAPVDADNTRRLREIVAAHGWPGIALDGEVGEDGAHAAWLLCQHAPPQVHADILPLLHYAADHGDASRTDRAYLLDRVLKHKGLRQRYGTQDDVDQQARQVLLWPVEDPDQLDARRAELGLEPEAASRARLQAETFPDPPPAGMEQAQQSRPGQAPGQG